MYLANKFQNIQGAADTLLDLAEIEMDELAPVAEAMERGGRLAAKAEVTDSLLDRCKPIAGTPDDCIAADRGVPRGRLHARHARALGRPSPRPDPALRRARPSARPVISSVAEIVELDGSRWDAWNPSSVAELLRDVDAPWAIAGGWAVDLFVGTQTREHADLEIVVPAGSFDEVAEALAGFELFVVVGSGRGVLLEDGRDLLADTHQVWVCDPETERFCLDVMREPSTGGTWVFRRDERIRRPYVDAVARTAAGIPYLRPELVLLFKAKSAESKDQLDFDTVRPLLAREDRAWLADALGLVHPGHRWITELAA